MPLGWRSLLLGWRPLLLVTVLVATSSNGITTCSKVRMHTFPSSFGPGADSSKRLLLKRLVALMASGTYLYFLVCDERIVWLTLHCHPSQAQPWDCL